MMTRGPHQVEFPYLTKHAGSLNLTKHVGFATIKFGLCDKSGVFYDEAQAGAARGESGAIIFSCLLIIYSLLINHGKLLTKGGKTQE